ncbi:hypothetical protein PT300_05720 [Enterobacteriaceae bacterium ESL0689]|nr:hypothetical protein [Enterobacteriaceae bacterium ESL0689]
MKRKADRTDNRIAAFLLTLVCLLSASDHPPPPAWTRTAWRSRSAQRVRNDSGHSCGPEWQVKAVRHQALFIAEID